MKGKPLANHRWEAFAIGYAGGMSATDAYIGAGFSPNGAGQAGHKLLSKAEIQARIAELQGRAAKRAEITHAELVRMAQDLHAAAFRDKAYGPAASALKELGVLTGHRVERRDVDVTAEVVTGTIGETPMSREEFEQRYMIKDTPPGEGQRFN
jgi:phage terminase small subunit